ncbi:hypothetical protein [Aeoliella mucimassa]|uniref:Uncharacterized protein n=1 Tax=Aeoliella mucimassa TaxID=2527972 RepID=A0A518ATT3_9BACT|nr:hypothetical protein [Aeoliella mucimassa]QDU58141.1 hypothetical protein Pan181_43680 [Aeoliella mucimassa]
MAICPKCQASMGQTAVKCEACGYDFSEPTSKRSLADTSRNVGNIFLMLGGVTAGVWSLLSGVSSIGLLLMMEFTHFAISLSLFLIAAALVVVFMRAQEDD